MHVNLPNPAGGDVNIVRIAQDISHFVANSHSKQARNTGWVRLIRSDSSARFSFELSRNLN